MANSVITETYSVKLEPSTRFNQEANMDNQYVIRSLRLPDETCNLFQKLTNLKFNIEEKSDAKSEEEKTITFPITLVKFICNGQIIFLVKNPKNISDIEILFPQECQLLIVEIKTQGWVKNITLSFDLVISR